MSPRKLWKVQRGEVGTVHRPESQIKVYSIYVRNELGAWRAGVRPADDEVIIWVDERDGAGWCRFDVIDLNELLALEERT